mmetsp:Transcript_12711/g.16058  ORF Transcript_12711/g.16058 Transcript_12711/m.16058 type:complete len:406 (+) Transcript_12711:84-1301(+)
MNISIPHRTQQRNESSLLMKFALMPARKKLVCLASFLLISAYSINHLFAPEMGDEMYDNKHLNRAKNRPHIDLANIEELKKEVDSEKPAVKKEKLEKKDDVVIDTVEKNDTMEDNEGEEEEIDMPILVDDSFDDDLNFNDLDSSQDFYEDDMDDIVSDYVALFRASDIEEQLESISDSDALHDWLAPQGRAFQWLVNEDERMINADDPFLVQRYVLAVLFYATSGDNWDNDSVHWMTLLHECYWNRKVKGKNVGVVECDEDKRVIRLDLPETNLQGSIPSEIGLLDGLKTLNLDSNGISGTIPSTISRLTNLTSLSFEYNRLTGKIPSKLSKLTNLAELKLNHNDLSGTVPAAVCTLRQQSLYLFWSDCDDHGHVPAVECSCCTECCDGLDMCYSQIPLDDDFER